MASMDAPTTAGERASATGQHRSLRDDVIALQRRLRCAPNLPQGSDTVDDAERVSLISALEDLKNTAAAVQARLAVDLDRSVRAQHATAGLPPEQHGRGVAAQLALARRESPHRAQHLLGLAKDLLVDLTCTYAAFRSGRLTEFRATLVAREAGCLDQDGRARLDAELFAPDASGEVPALDWGSRQLAAGARALAYLLDPAGVARRASQAAADRCVTLRPAPDTMTYLTALLPVADGVATYAALTRQARRLRAAGDPRSKGQVMADRLVDAVLVRSGERSGKRSGEPDGEPPGEPSGKSGAEAAGERRRAPGITVELIMSDATLLRGGHDAALLVAEGVPATPIPARTARELVADALADSVDQETAAWVRRLYADPAGQLVAMTSVQRFVRGSLADYLRIRDQGMCRTPWCDAPIAESDHVSPSGAGGPTAAANTQGYCIACNRAKQAPGWRQIGLAVAGRRHRVETVTPTGHRYRSTAARPPVPLPEPRPGAQFDLRPAARCAPPRPPMRA